MRLEDRLVPAYNLAIDAVDTAHVSQSDAGQVRIFTSLADDAVLNVSAIQAAFDAGLDVVISTGEGGGSTGNIVWNAGADAYFTGSGEFSEFHSLTLQTDPLDSGRNVDIEANLYGYPAYNSPFQALVVNSGGPNGAVTLHQVAVAGGFLFVNAGEAGIFLNGNLSTHGGALGLTGNVLLENSVVLDTSADDLGTFATGGPVSISGTIDGDSDLKDLRINAGNATIALDGDLGGVQNLLGNLNIVGNLYLAENRVITVQSQFTLAAGKLDLGSQELTVATGQFWIGDGSTADNATLQGIGTVQADLPIQVASNGVVSPGGLHFTGTMQVDGSIEFQRDSKLVVDLDAIPDNLHATGSVQLDAGAMLFGGSGVLSGSGPFQIVTADGGLMGTFANTQNPIGLADDVVTVTYTSGAVLLGPAAAPSDKQMLGVTPDGTFYTIKLTGGGNARMQAFESFRVDSAVQYVTVAKEVVYTVYETVAETQKQVATVITYETVPVDTGGSIVYVTNPVLQAVEIEVTAYRQVPVQVKKTVFENVAVATEAFVHSFDIRVSNSSRANQLVIATTANGGFGSLDVGSIVVSGALGKLVAPTTSLGGLQVDGYLGRVRLTHLRGPMVAGGNRRQRTSIAIRQIDGDITTGSSITSLSSNQVGAQTIMAPRIGQLLITASPKNHLTGDFNASLVLDAEFHSALALRRVNIAGGISNSTWNIRGSIGAVTVNKAIENWTLGFADTLGSVRSLALGDVRQSNIYADGRIGKLNATSWDGYDIYARTLGTLNVSGSFSTYLSLDAGLSTSQALGTATVGSLAGTWTIRGSIGSVTVAQSTDGWSLDGRPGDIQALRLGQVTGLDLFANGHIGALEFTALADQYSYIEAGTIGTLNVKGDFTGSLSLTAADEMTMALRSAHLERIHNSDWDILGSIGMITVDDSATGWTLGSDDNLGNLRKLTIGGLLHDSAIQVAGRIGSIRAGQWQITDLTARSLGSLSVTGAPADGLAGDFLFSEVTLTGASKRVGLGTVAIAGRVWDSTFNILAGNVTSFTCGRFQHSGLYVGYDSINSQFLDPWNLGTFTSTSMPVVAHQSDLRTVAFQDSWILANRFGQVTLTGVTVDNGGATFGLRVNGNANAGQVRVSTAPFTPGVNVQPGSIMGDFQFLTS